MKVLAFDQAKNTGYAVFENDNLLISGVIKSTHKDYLNVTDEIAGKLCALINAHKPDVLLLEDVQAQSNLKTHKDLSMLLGALRQVGVLEGLTVKILHTSTWRTFLRKRYGITGRPKRTEWKKYSKQFVLDEYNKKVKDDEADAIAIGYYYISKGEF